MTIKSPLTGKTDIERLDTLSPSEIAEKWRVSMQIDVGGDFASLPVIEYWRCNTTGLYWYSPGEASGGRELYAQLERFDWYYMADKWEFQTALCALDKGGQVLEIGVGFGHFLKAASLAGHSVSGIELNASAAARVRALGFKVFEFDLATLSEQIKTPFDAVCAFQVLEHVSDPRGLLEGMLNVLRPGGQLILSVPNASVMRLIDPERIDLLNQPPHHISHWDEGVFRSLENFLPIKVRQIHREPLAPYHFEWFISAWSSLLCARIGLIPGRMLLNRITKPLIKKLLEHGLRHFISGHTLLAVMERRI